MATNSMPDETSTRDRILESARTQFLAHGFQGASIRKIASDAGFTPGALYGYFSSKEALFYAITDPVVSRIVKKLSDIENDILSLPDENRLMGRGDVFYPQIPELVDLIFEDREAVDLVINGSKGTKYEGFMADLVSRNVHAVSQAAEGGGDNGLRIFDQQMLEILMEGYIATLFHLVESGRDKQTVVRSMEVFGRVYELGVLQLMAQDGTL